jgi:hypothetical protein
MEIKTGRQTAYSAGRKALLAVIAALFLLPPACFAERKGTMDGTIVWPSDAGGWKRAGEPARYSGRAIFDYIDGAGEVFIAFNYRGLSVQRYERAGRPAIIAEVYALTTPQDAFGVFTWDRHDPEAGIGQGSEFGGGMLRFWKGGYFFSIYGEGEGKDQEEAVLNIGRKLAASVAEEGGPPRLMQALPDERRVADTARFVRSHVLLNQRCFIARENILGLDKETEAVFARYDLGKERTFLLLVAYPAEGKAKTAFAAFGKAYKLDGAGMGRTGDAWTGARLEGRRIIIVMNAPEADAAGRLMDAAMTKLKEGQ